MNLLIAEARVLEFPQLCENCRCTAKACRCDVFVGCCEGCGNTIYCGNTYTAVEAINGQTIYTCSECLDEAAAWSTPAIRKVA